MNFKALADVYERLSTELDDHDPFEVHLLEYQWSASQEFWDGLPLNITKIESEFSADYAQMASLLIKELGSPNLKFENVMPVWYDIQVISMFCWKQSDKFLYVCFHKEDKELPYEIKLGVILAEAVE